MSINNITIHSLFIVDTLRWFSNWSFYWFSHWYNYV